MLLYAISPVLIFVYGKKTTDFLTKTVDIVSFCCFYMMF